MPSLFSCFGVELEYMIVDRTSLDVRPIADRLLAAANNGQIAGDVERGPIGWSNELSLHVIELKCNGPAPTLDGLETLFQQNIAEMNRLLEPLDARLLPTGMHPWMDPHRESRLWPHDYNAVYEAFDRIFGCRGHGWSNLQSTHLNLPFDGDDEFGRLHAAIRIVLPLLPALAASSPVMDGKLTGCMDNRLEVYRHNSRRVPRVAGSVIPEPAFTQADYERLILQPLYRDIAPHDPQGILQEEWLNARGAIARFSRGSIEIRILDIQEFPAADLAICQIVVALLRQLVSERWATFSRQKACATDDLAAVFVQTIRDADETIISDADYLSMFGRRGPISAGDLWRSLADELLPDLTLSPACEFALQTILCEGPLARRIVMPLTTQPDRATLVSVYRELANRVIER